MTVATPTSIDGALDALATSGAEVVAGGTDFMVEVNSGRRRPESIVSIGRIAELREWSVHDGTLRLGAGVTYADLLDEELAAAAPALAQAARTVGSPQIRNAGTIGGNLATASPAGDTLPVLVALDAIVEIAGTGIAGAEVAGADGRREVPLSEFITGPKRTALRPGELVVAVRVPSRRGHQEFRKIGVRNAMVIAVASLALAVDEGARQVRCGLGSVGPVPLRAPEAEGWLAERVDWSRVAVDDPSVFAAFGSMVERAARPIDDHRSTAAYRAHAVGVLATRAAAAALTPTAA